MVDAEKEAKHLAEADTVAEEFPPALTGRVKEGERQPPIPVFRPATFKTQSGLYYKSINR